MFKVESIPEAGLTIIRQAVEPQRAHAFQAEMIARLSPVKQAILNGDVVLESPKVVSTGFFLPRVVENQKFGTTIGILNDIGLLDTGAEVNLTVNYQPANTAQVFHRDFEVEDDKVMILHGADGGAFDYHRAEFVKDHEVGFETVEANAGDLVIQARPYFWHRGRNMSAQPRVTLAMSELSPVFS